jgi:hypothetical protein
LKRVFGRICAGLSLIIFAGALFVSGGCAAPAREGFAIYLTEGDIPPAQMEALSHVDIAAQPVIALDDIIRYNAQTHEMILTGTALERIARLEVPVRGKSFVVCVDRNPVYWGAFWTPVSSISFDGVTIWKPPGPQESRVITLELGYPSSSFYQGEDPRNNSAVMKSLQQAGKLITSLSIAEVEKLPHSMKGYELYSWVEDNRWHFTLITGTNRDKTPAEIISNEDFISEAGWVRVHVAGVDAVKNVLSKIPRNEEIFWLAQPRAEHIPPGNISFMLPPEQDIAAIKEQAGRCGLRLAVQTP